MMRITYLYTNSPPRHRKHSLNHSLHNTSPTPIRISGAKTKKQKPPLISKPPISYRRPLNLSNGNRAHGPVSGHVALLVYRYFFPFEVDDMTNFKHHYPPPHPAPRPASPSTLQQHDCWTLCVCRPAYPYRSLAHLPRPGIKPGIYLYSRISWLNLNPEFCSGTNWTGCCLSVCLCGSLLRGDYSVQTDVDVFWVLLLGFEPYYGRVCLSYSVSQRKTYKEKLTTVKLKILIAVSFRNRGIFIWSYLWTATYKTYGALFLFLKNSVCFPQP